MEITLQKKMSSSLSKATSDNLKIIRSMFVCFIFSCCFLWLLFRQSIFCHSFCFHQFYARFPVQLSQFVCICCCCCCCSIFLSLSRSSTHSLLYLLQLFFYHSVPTFFSICFNVLFAVHVIAYRPKTKATNINKC